MEIGKQASTTEGETVGSGKSSHYGSHGEKEIYDFTRKAFPAWRTHARLSVFGGTLDALKWSHPVVPICIVIRETHTHARQTKQPARCDRALADVALGPTLMSHDCIQMPEFFPTRPLSVPARCARLERKNTAARFLVPFFAADGNDGSNGTLRGNNRSWASCSFTAREIQPRYGSSCTYACVQIAWQWRFEQISWDILEFWFVRIVEIRALRNNLKVEI